jgi:hypothetical protein
MQSVSAAVGGIRAGWHLHVPWLIPEHRATDGDHIVRNGSITVVNGQASRARVASITVLIVRRRYDGNIHS